MKQHDRNNPQRRSLLRGLTCLALAVLALTAVSSHAAANRFWSGAGTWDTSTANWGTVTTGPYNTFTWVNANNDTGVFEGTAGTVSLGTGITVGGLQFDAASYIVTANTLTFGVSGNIVANQNATINSAIALASGTITKTGSGTLTLGGNNTYAAGTTVSLGTLKAGSTTAFSANSIYSVAAGATLDLGGFNNSISSLATATGTITDSSAPGSGGTLKITTFAATAQLFTGSLALQWNGPQGASTMLTAAGNTFSGGATVGGAASVNNRFLLGNTTIGSGTPGALTSGVWGTGPLTLGVTAADWAQIMFQSASTINNAIVVNSALGNSDAAGTFRVDSSGNVIAGTINANLANATFRNGGNGAGAVSLTNTISGSSGLTLLAGNGTGTLNVTLTNTGTANSYAGNTTISSVTETLTLGAAEQIPNGAGKGNLIITNGTFKMGGFSETINGLSGSGIVDGVSGSPTLTVGDGNATGAFSGVIKSSGGTLALTKIGTGTLTLSGISTFGGNTTINAGRLQGVVGGSCANSTLILNATTATNSVSITDNTKGWTNAALTVSAAGVLDFNFGTNTPGTTVSPLKITGLADFSAAVPTVSVIANSILASGTYPLMTWGSANGDPSTATLITSMPTGFAGTLSVSGSTLNLVITSTMDYWDNNGTTGGFGTAAGTWASPTSGNSSQGWSTDGTGGTLPADFTTTATTGVSFGNGATGLGAGTIAVSGLVTNGAMTFASGSGAITLSGGTINFPAAGTITVNNTSNNISSVVAGASTSLTKAGAGILTLSGANTYTGATTVNGGTLNLTGQGTNSSITVNSGGAFNEGASVVITGSGVTFTQNSSGNTSTLAGTNTYTGATTVSAGTLKAGSTMALSTNSAFSVAAGATLDLGGFNNTISSLSTTATGTITDSSAPGSGGTLRITSMGSTPQSFTGSLGLQLVAISQNVALTATGNTFSGGTTFGIGSGGANTRFLLGNTTIGSGTPGALTSGYFGIGAITLGVNATDRPQIMFQSASTINNAIVVNSALGNSDAAGTFRVDSSGNVIAGTINANLANATFRNGGNGAGAVSLTNTISGSSGLTLLAGNGTGTLNVTLTNTGTANSYAGNTTISSVTETLTLGAAEQIPNGAGKGNLIITNGTFKMGGFSETINGLSGSGIVDGVSGSPTLTVGDGNATGAFSGVIKSSGGTLALTKIGTGTLTLSGISTFGGNTTINAGTLLVNGQITASPVTVNTGGALAGVGTIGSVVTNNAGAILYPGNGGIGTLTLSSNLTLNVTSTNRFVVTTGGVVSNSVAVTGQLSPNGSVVEINTAGTQLAAGTYYHLFTYGTTNGTQFTATPVFDTAQSGLVGTITNDGAGNVNLVVSAASTDASLLNLVVNSSEAMFPTFSSGTTNYTATNVNASTTVTVLVTNNSAFATNVLYLNGSSLGRLTNEVTSVALPVGVGSTNVIRVQVTAQDGLTVSNYFVTVTRQPSSDASLFNLVVNASVSPTFISGTTNYYATNINASTTVTVLVTNNSAFATNVLYLNGTSYGLLTNKLVSLPLAVGVGSTNVIRVQVTAQDGLTVSNYFVTVTRLGSTNDWLANLVISNGGGALTFYPSAFTTNNTGTYFATNASGAGPVTVLVTNVDATATNTLLLGGNSQGLLTNEIASAPLTLAVGTTNVTVQVVSQDLSQTNNYIVALTQLGASASPTTYLTSLVVSNAANAALGFNPPFQTNTVLGEIYAATNSLASTPLTVTVVNVDSAATNTLFVNGTQLQLLTNGITSFPLTGLVAGTTNVTVQTVSQDLMVTNNYTVNVTLLGTNSLLSSLSLTPAGTLSPTFNAATNNYNATNTYVNKTVIVAATSADANATLALSFTNGAYGAVVTNSLSVGGNTLGLPTNTLAVRVVSQDLSQTNIYTVNVLLQPSQTVPHLTNSVSGNNLVLSWPADHLGYHLLVQTNNLNKGVSGNINDWGTVAGTTTILSTNIAIIKSGVTNEYYKLVYP